MIKNVLMLFFTAKKLIISLLPLLVAIAYYWPAKENDLDLLKKFYGKSIWVSDKIANEMHGDYRGMFSTKLIRKNEYIIKGYRDGVVCGEDVTKKFPFLHFITYAMSSKLGYNAIDHHSLLALWLLIENKKHAYVNILPDMSHLQAHFQPDIIKLLPDQKAQQQAMTMFTNFTVTQYRLLSENLDITFNEYKWANTMVTSRVGGLYLKPGVEEKSTCFIPIFDMMNHGRDNNVLWNVYSQEGRPLYTLKANRDIQPGEELYISYDDNLNNIDLFTRYGFTINDEPLDPTMYISFMDMLDACKMLNNDLPKCSKLLQTKWPFYNSTRADDDQFQMRIREGELATIYRPVLEEYEKIFQRRSEIILIEALKSKQEPLPNLESVASHLKLCSKLYLRQVIFNIRVLSYDCFGALAFFMSRFVDDCLSLIGRHKS